MDETMRIARDLIEAVKVLQEQKKSIQDVTYKHYKIDKKIKDIAKKFPQGTLPQAQTFTNPTQLRALCSTPHNHQ